MERVETRDQYDKDNLSSDVDFANPFHNKSLQHRHRNMNGRIEKDSDLNLKVKNPDFGIGIHAEEFFGRDWS